MLGGIVWFVDRPRCLSGNWSFLKYKINHEIASRPHGEEDGDPRYKHHSTDSLPEHEASIPEGNWFRVRHFCGAFSKVYLKGSALIFTDPQFRDLRFVSSLYFSDLRT